MPNPLDPRPLFPRAATSPDRAGRRRPLRLGVLGLGALLAMLGLPGAARAQSIAPVAVASDTPAPAADADASATDAAPQGAGYLGWARFIGNDIFGDGKDRWRTGAAHVSILWGEAGSDATQAPVFGRALPAQPFALMEYRLGGEIIAPADLERPRSDDRRYVSKADLLAISHMGWQGNAVQIGAGLTAIGPDTLPWRVQRDLHRLLDQPEPIAAETQLGNRVFPTLTAELRRDIALPAGTVLQPFVALRLAEEDLLRAGVDLQWGLRSTDAVWLRDDQTGFLHPALGHAPGDGLGLTLGVDATHVADSALFPARGVRPRDTRYRARAGVTLFRGQSRIFYGASWLSEEFHGQPEGQVVGALQLDLRF